MALLLGAIGYSQEIKTKTESAISGNIAYFLNTKLTPGSELKAIKPEEIDSVRTVRRDTLIGTEKYSAQIFVVLKKKG